MGAYGATLAASLGTFGFFILIIAAVLALFIPFFIFRIRNETITTNRNLKRIIRLLEAQADPAIELTEVNRLGKKIKVCIRCGARNMDSVTRCQNCGARF